MKFLKVILQAVVAGTLLSGPLDALAQQEPPRPPKSLKPVRHAQGKMRLFKTVMWYAEDGKPEIKTTLVCLRDTAIPVFDTRNAGTEWSASPAHVSCLDEVNGVKVTIMGYASLTLSSGKSFGHDRDMKAMNAGIYFSYFSPLPEPDFPKLPGIPQQTTYTPDLNQVFLGVVGTAEQYGFCETDGGPAEMEPIEPKANQADGKPKCRIVNPVAYGMQWEAEDTKQ